jgi:hypothetical protein
MWVIIMELLSTDTMIQLKEDKGECISDKILTLCYYLQLEMNLIN